MRVERIQAEGGGAAALAREMRDADATNASATSVRESVRDVVERVAAEGDAAVLDLTARWDTEGRQPWPLRVDPLELTGALDGLHPELREALELAAANVRTVSLAEAGPDREVELAQGQRVLLREIPLRRAAIYVPGGRAPYPSTVVMGTVAAQVAGVEEVVVCAPPRSDGDSHAEILGACALCGVDEVYRMGGAQAVAALALGTATVPRVDMVVGPGNAHVQEAKRLLCDRVGIDSFAGPSELLVLLGDDAAAGPVALDLLAQAEHGPDSRLAAVSPSGSGLDALAAALEALGAGAAAADCCRLVEVGDTEQALAFAEAWAPEHLQLVGEEAEALAPRVRSAGCVFVGAAAGTAFGDYVAGSNHVLPTGGAARFASVLSPRTFRRRMAQVQLDGAAGALARPGALIARAEGFEAHARSMEARMHDNAGHV